MMAPREAGGTPKKSGYEEDPVMRQLEINYGKLKTHTGAGNNTSHGFGEIA